MKVVLDTNIYVSAIIFGGIPRKILEAAIQGKFEVFISGFILNELMEVLKKKFSYTDPELVKVKSLIEDLATIKTPTKTMNIIAKNHPDNRVLECCNEVSADYLVTGDKQHILPLKKIENTIIVDPTYFAEIMNKIN